MTELDEIQTATHHPPTQGRPTGISDFTLQMRSSTRTRALPSAGSSKQGRKPAHTSAYPFPGRPCLTVSGKATGTLVQAVLPHVSALPTLWETEKGLSLHADASEC